MAITFSEENCKSHQRVDSFLKRHLSQRNYEGIRAVERCIVVSEEFNHAFKFVVLGDVCLYILENPPRLQKDIQFSVDIKDIVSVTQVIIIILLDGLLYVEVIILTFLGGECDQ